MELSFYNIQLILAQSKEYLPSIRTVARGHLEPLGHSLEYAMIGLSFVNAFEPILIITFVIRTQAGLVGIVNCNISLRELPSPGENKAAVEQVMRWLEEEMRTWGTNLKDAQQFIIPVEYPKPSPKE